MAECAAQASSEVEFASFPDEDGVETTPPPLTAQQAQQWRKNHRSLSLTGTLLMQMTVSAFVSLLVWALTQSRSAAGRLWHNGPVAAADPAGGRVASSSFCLGRCQDCANGSHVVHGAPAAGIAT